MRLLRNARLADGRNVDVLIDIGAGTIIGVAAAGSTATDGGVEVDGMNVEDLGAGCCCRPWPSPTPISTRP